MIKYLPVIFFNYGFACLNALKVLSATAVNKRCVEIIINYFLMSEKKLISRLQIIKSCCRSTIGTFYNKYFEVNCSESIVL